jgi:hypothetical protein
VQAGAPQLKSQPPHGAFFSPDISLRVITDEGEAVGALRIGRVENRLHSVFGAIGHSGLAGA